MMNNAKRAPEESPQRPTKTKRARYVAVACDGCKRRKVRCGGQMPCERCYDLAVACVYQKDNTERSKESQLFEGISLQMQALNGKLDTLTEYVTTSKEKENGIHTAADANSNRYLSEAHRQKRRTHSSGALDQPQSLCPGYRGPTSSSFIFEVANDSMKKKGLSPETTKSDTRGNPGKTPPTPPYQQREASGSLSSHDALHKIGVTKASQLCKIYDQTYGIMCPVLDMPRVFSHAHRLFAPHITPLNAESGTSPPGHGEDDPNFENNILKLICAISLASVSCGEYSTARDLYEDVKDASEVPIWDAMGLRGLQYLTLVALYHVQIGQDVRASRIIGSAARLCLEMGLNRREVLMRTFPEEASRGLAVRTFWSIYMLDMRASCGTGIPFVIQDADIDPALPEPDSTYLFLKTMITFARLSGKVWRVANAFTPPDNTFATDNIEYLDYQVLQWQKRIPESLRYNASESRTLMTSTGEHLFARVVTYARINQLRNLIYRRVLYSNSRIAQHMLHAQTVVDIAKSTVNFFANLNNATGMYQAQPAIFNHFLISALGVLLLAVTNAPEHFIEQCSDEYYTALRLLKQSAVESHVSMRLWKTVEDLERFGPMLGVARSPGPYQPHFDAVVDAYQQDQLAEKDPLTDVNQYITSQFQSSGFRDDFASLFGFTTDTLDHALFLTQDTCGSNSYGAQLDDIFGGAEQQ